MRALRLARLALSVLAYGVLGLLALAGVALSTVVGWAGSSLGRTTAASALIRLADAEVAGSLALGGVELTPGGEIAIRDFRAFDPDGKLVLQVDRMVLSADVTRLRNKVVGLEVELDGATVLVDEDADGRLSLARAFAPQHPAPPRPARKQAAGSWRDPASGWTVRVKRLAVRGASVWWQDAQQRTRLEVQDLSLDARAVVGARRSRAELSLRGQALSPVPGALSLDVRGLLDGDRLRVPVLRAQLGETGLTALADLDLEKLTGRAALTRATVIRQEAKRLLAGAPAGADLDFTAYAEADGRVATAAARVEPRTAEGAGGGEAAVAARLDGVRAAGFDLVTRALDPSSIHAAAPAGSVTLKARGGLSGESLAAARGSLDLDLSPSRLRGGELGPATALVKLDQGSWEATRLSLTAPGLRLEGSGSYRQGGAAAARLTAEVQDLARAAANAGKLLDLELPRLAGRAKVEATLSGTAAAPAVTAQLEAPLLSLGKTSVSGVQAKVEASGPFRPGQLRVEARVQRLSSGAEAVAQGLSLEASASPIANAPGAASARLSASGLVQALGKEPVSVEAEGTLPADRKAFRLSALGLSYPGTRYALEAPATLTFLGPRVDRLALVAGPRRIEVAGGLGPRRALDARVQVVKLDLARLPAGLIPAGQGIAGDLSLDARAGGTTDRPEVQLEAQVEDGAFRTEKGVGVRTKLRYDGGKRRASGQLSLARAKGGTAELDADLPLPLRGRRAEAVSAQLQLSSLPLTAILELAGQALPLSGLLDGAVHLSGSPAAPALRAELKLSDGVFRDLSAIGLDATVEVAERATAALGLRLAGRPALRLEARAPLALAALLDEPGRTVRALLRAPATADASFPGTDLAALSGKLGVPEGLRGTVTGEVHATGTPAAPRAKADLSIADAVYAGYSGLAGRLLAEAGEDQVQARLDARLQDQELVQLSASLGQPAEKLTSRRGLEAAALRLDATVPGLALEKALPPSDLALGGTVDARLHADGTLARPSIVLEGAGRGIRVQDRPVGELRLAARAAGEKATAELGLDPPSGGKLTARAEVAAPISLELRAAQLRSAPAKLALRADAVDLGFLPALLPGVVRAAAGKLDADLTAEGPLSEPEPRGTVRLTDGRVGLMAYGDWSGIALDGEVTAQAVELRNLEAHRGEGSLVVKGALRGLDTKSAQLDGRLDARRLTLTRDGMELATVTLGVKASGTYAERRLQARLDLPEALVRLADKLPRSLQDLKARPDIIVGPRPRQKPAGPAAAAAEGPPAKRPLVVNARLVSPGKFLVQRDSPRIRVELKADVTYEHQPAGDYMSGSVEVVRGTVEPLSDRRFEVKRGRLTFTGGPPRAAVLDAEALYENPAANVTVTVTGPVLRPEIGLKSTPPLDDGQIAMLIATGQTDIRAGGSGAAGAAQADASRQVAQKLGFAVFNTFIRDQLPFSSGDVSLDASAAKVSGYLPGTKIYVGFTRRFDANHELGENEDEVRMEYSLTPHWTLEGRWGNANTGGASLIWSKDY